MKKTLLLLSMALAPAALLAQAKQPPVNKMLSSEGGRYVFGQISDYRRDQYMLDTSTGRLWKIVARKNRNPDGTEAPGEFEILDVVPYNDINGSLHLTPK